MDPNSTWNATSIGNLLLPLMAKDMERAKTLTDAADRYFTMHNRWQRAKQVAKAYREGIGWHGSEPTPEEQADRDMRVTILTRALKKIKEGAFEFMKNMGLSPHGKEEAFSIVHNSIMFNYEISASNTPVAVVMLTGMATEMGFSFGHHPFEARNQRVESQPAQNNA